MIIIGIDPGTATTGWGAIKIKKERVGKENDRREVDLLGYGCIVTESKEEMGKRLNILHKSLRKVMREYKPDYVVIEKLFFGANSTSALSVGQARGVIMLSATESLVEIVEYTGLQVKLTVAGHGRADKEAVQKAVRKYLGVRKIPNPTDQTGKDVFRFRDDAYDAVAAAICHVIKSDRK